MIDTVGDVVLIFEESFILSIRMALCCRTKDAKRKEARKKKRRF